VDAEVRSATVHSVERVRADAKFSPPIAGLLASEKIPS
jgi:hypothetical protein